MDNGGTGNYIINGPQTINVTSRFEANTLTITYTSDIAKVTVNGVAVSSGWSGYVQRGDVITATSTKGVQPWYYYYDGIISGSYSGNVATCTVPTLTGTGSLEFTYHYENRNYRIKRGGVCRSGGWTFYTTS